MAELDDKLLKNLDKTLEDMTTHLRGIETALKGVKNGLEATFNPAILKSFSDELRGMKAARLIDAEANVSEVNKIYSAIQEFDRRVKTGTKLEFLSEAQIEKYKQELNEIERRLDAVAGKRLKGEEWLDRKALYDRRDMLRDIVTSDQPAVSVPLSTAELKEAVELLKRYKELYANITKGEQQRAVELANIKKKEAEESLKQELQLNKEIAAEEKKRQQEAEATAKQRLKEAQDANKAWTQAADAEQKAQAKMRGAQSKQAYREQADAIQQQIVYQKQLMALRKEYIALNQKKDRTDKESADLERIKTKIKEIINLSKQLNKEQAGTHNIAFKATEYERFRQSIKGATKATKEHNAELNKMLPTLQRLASAFGIAFSIRGLAQFGKKLIEVRGEFELQQVALRSILQNKQLADEIWDKTLRASLQSPYTAMQLTTYTKQLAAYRIETAKLFDTTKRLADVSAGLGVDMQRLILAYGQVKAANYLRASEIRQFTEAGVNILGELSQYFTETREGMYSTAQVMDMVQKRMVKFEDVAEIFKRMTDQGGIFYNMQYIQSQTVKGQMMKLKDAFDQMLNSIGKGNEGVIKNLIAAMNNMVQNWRTWAVVLKSIGWAAALGYMSKFVFQLNGITQASTATLKSFAKLKMGLQDLGKALRANWLSLVVAGVTALLTAMASLNKRMKEINREIDEQNLRLYETRQNFKDMKSKIEANNTALKQQSANTESLNKAQKENESIMQKLRNEYPQLAEQMSIATNGIIDMNGALDANIRKLNEQMTILNAMKQGNWIVDSDQKNLTDWQGVLAKFKTTLLSAQSSARTKMMQMELDGKTEEPIYDIYKKVSEIDLSGNILDAVSAFNSLNGELLAYKANLYKGTPTRSESLYSILGIEVGNLRANWSYNRVTEVLDKFAPALQSFYENGIKDNADFLKTINEQYGGDVTQFIKENAEKINKATIDGLNTANDVLINTLKPQTEEMRIFLNQELNKRFGTSGIDFFSKSTKDTTTKTDEDEQNKIDAAWRRRINLLEEMKKRYDELSKSAYGYAKSESKVRTAFDDSFKEIFKDTGISMSQIDFTSMQGMFDSLRLALSKASGISDAVREEIMKKIDSYEARIEISAEVKVRENFAREIEKMFSDYELTIDLQKINLPADAAKDLLGLDYTSLSEVMNKITDWRNQQIAKEAYSEDDMKLYETWMKKVTDKMYAMQKEKAKQYTKYLEHELSERAKLEMQYTTDVAFVKANYQDGSQKDMILANLEKDYSDAMNELKWKSFKESSFYVEMMQDLTTMPSEYLNMMMTKLNEWVEKADDLSPKALKEVLKAREKIIEAQVAMSPIRALGTSLGGIREVQQGYFLNEDYEEEMFSSNIKEARRQLEGVILAREQNMDLIRQQLDAEESLLGKLTAQENIQRTINELVGKGYEGVGVTSTLDEIQRAIDDNRSLLNQIEPTQAAGETDEDFQKRLRQYTEEQAELQGIINLLIELKTQRQQADAMGVDMSQPASASKEGTLANVRKYKQELDRLEKTQSKDQSRLVYFKQYNTAVHGLAQNIADVTGKVKGVNGAIYNMMDALGETDEITDLWKQFGDAMLDSITNTLNLIPALITGYTAAGVAINSAMGIIGLIAEAIQLTITLITFLVQLSDKQKDKEIENLQKRIDELKNAYERLEKQIEKTWDTMSYIENYDKMVKNINDQIRALEAQREAESSKKKSDDDKISDYNKAIQDAEDELEELRQKQIEVFGGLGEVNYRSAAQEFVDAWKEAFLETGDGLQGLQDHFDEFLNEWFVKQATMRIAGRMLEPLFRDIDKAVDESSLGGTSVLLSELQAIREKFAQMAPDISANLEALAGTFGLGEGEGGLSGLAAGIQGMTEEQANILEAYWNSVRMYTASIDMNVSRIAEMLGAGSRDITNPQLQQLQLIAANAQATHQLLLSTSKSGHPMGGYGFKVFND